MNYLSYGDMCQADIRRHCPLPDSQGTGELMTEMAPDSGCLEKKKARDRGHLEALSRCKGGGGQVLVEEGEEGGRQGRLSSQLWGSKPDLPPRINVGQWFGTSKAAME